MTTGNPARLRTAEQRVLAFYAEGRPQGAKPADLPKLQVSPHGWPVTRDALASQLKRRLQGDQQPSQLETSYCGPAAFLYCLLEDLPDIYVDYAIQLWQRGEYDFGTVDIHANATTTRSLGAINYARQVPHAPQHISSLDWMTMASLSASTRPWFTGGRGAKPDDLGMSITYPWVIKGWFASVGMRAAYSCMGLGVIKSDLRSFVELMSHWGRCWLVLQIDSSLIEGGNPSTLRQRHWVVVDPHRQATVQRGDGKLVPLGGIGDQFATVQDPRIPTALLDERLNSWKMDLKLVTWGKENTGLKLSTLGDVPSRFYGGFAFPRQH